MTSLSKSTSSYAAVFTAIIAAVLCMLMLASTFSSACGFDATVQEQASHDIDNTHILNLPNEDARRASTYEKIRIKVSTLDLYDTSKYCTAAGETKPDFKGSTRTCTEDDIFTAEKRSKLINVILPEAVAKLQDSLRVVRLTSNLVVGSSTQCTGGFTIPSAHTGSGVEDADYILYVGAGPTADGNVAFAGGCQNDGGSPHRIIVGRANFGPKYLTTDNMPTKDAVSTGIHELLHAFGYSSSEFSTAGIVTSMTIRGDTKNVITATKPKAEAREWMGCGSLAGVELEHEGGSGTAGSHPERRVYPDDIMAGAGGEALSVVTLTVMEALGVYLPYYNESENMITGKGLGCEWAEGGCTASIPARVYCPTVSSDDVGCTGNLKAYGPCSSAFLTDDCPYYNPFSNKKCYDVSQADVASTGDTYDNNSRCYKTSGTFKQSGSTVAPSNDKRCLKSQCFGNILSFTVGRSSVNYITCSEDQSKSYSGYQGQVVCPNITLMCDSLQKYHNGTSQADSLNPVVPNTRGKTNRASDFIYTTKLTLTVTGSNWNTVIDNHYSDLFVAMQGDVAQVLNVEAQQVWVMAVNGATTRVQFIVNVNAPDKSTSFIQGEFAVFLGRRAWMPRTANLYSEKSGSNDNAILGAAGASDKPENACTPYLPSFEDTDQCNGFIAGLVIAAIAFIALIVVSIYCCCCKYEDPPQKMDRSKKYEVRVPK